MKKITSILLFGTLLALIPFACGKKADTSLKLAGSDTIVQLAQMLAKKYMEKNPAASVSVQGGGSGTGIAALLNDSTHIANSSRDIKEQELQLATDKGIQIKANVIALDGIAIIVNGSNAVEKLTIEQLSDIYSGKIKNWKEVGGKDQEILVISRENNSGTHVYFKEEVLRRAVDPKKNPDSPYASLEFGSNVTFAVSSQAEIDQVKSNPAAIAYVGMGWISPEVKTLAIAALGKKEYFIPNTENVLNKKYPIARSLNMYENQKFAQMTAPFMEFVLSEEGQQIVKEAGFVPVGRK